MITLNDNKGNSLQSPLTNDKAADICRNLTNNFPQDLAKRYLLATNNPGYRGLSQAQTYWMHRLAIEASQPEETAQIGDMHGIITLFDKVKHHLKFPKIRLAVEPDWPIVMSLSGATSKFPNTVKVTNGGPYGNQVWYGRVELDGTMRKSRHCNDKVIEVLRRFAADPAGVSALHGQLTGQCCFCGQPLTDARSLAVGYGPVCSDNYGLPWGDKVLSLYVPLVSHI